MRSGKQTLRTPSLRNLTWTLRSLRTKRMLQVKMGMETWKWAMLRTYQKGYPSSLQSRSPPRPRRRSPGAPEDFYKTNKALNDPRIKDKARQMRLNRIKKAINDIAIKNGISLILLCAMVIKNDTYIHERQLARIAELIIDGGLFFLISLFRRQYI